MAELFLQQQLVIGSIYFNCLHDSRARELMRKPPPGRAETILLELIPLHHTSRIRNPRSLIFTAEPIPLWSANVELVTLIDESKATEFLRLNADTQTLQ